MSRCGSEVPAVRRLFKSLSAERGQHLVAVGGPVWQSGDPVVFYSSTGSRS